MGEKIRLDHVGVLFVTDLVREALESPIGRNAVLTAEITVLITLQVRKCNSAVVMIKV